MVFVPATGWRPSRDDLRVTDFAGWNVVELLSAFDYRDLYQRERICIFLARNIGTGETENPRRIHTHNDDDR